MRRKDAEQLIGTKVLAWTAAWGEYIGTLEEVLPTRPWRAKVKVESVYAFPAMGLSKPGGSWQTRKPFEEGRAIEVGGVNIQPYEQEYVSYAESIETLFHEKIKQFQGYKQMHEKGERCMVPLWAIDRTLTSLEEIRDYCLSQSKEQENEMSSM